MATLTLSKEFEDMIQYFPGETLEQKISSLILDNLKQKLKECEEEIYQYELKYKMDFSEFRDAWERDEISDKYSHQVERDYMIWEGLEAEKKKLLSLIMIV